MDSTTDLKTAIYAVFASWERYLPGPNIHATPVLDVANDRYILQDVELTGDRFVSRTLAHLEIRDGKIWILTDNTEEGIAPELAAQGVPKNHIVLAFYSPALREMSEFAVA